MVGTQDLRIKVSAVSSWCSPESEEDGFPGLRGFGESLGVRVMPLQRVCAREAACGYKSNESTLKKVVSALRRMGHLGKGDWFRVGCELDLQQFFRIDSAIKG